MAAKEEGKKGPCGSAGLFGLRKALKELCGGKKSRPGVLQVSAEGPGAHPLQQEADGGQAASIRSERQRTRARLRRPGEN